VAANENDDVNRMWVASAAANAADGIATTATPLLVVSLSREPLALSTLNTLWFLPWLLLGLIVGALIDRWDRRRAMIWAAAGRAALAALFAAAIGFGHGGLALVYAIVFVFSSAEIVYDTAARALLPSLIGAERLEAVNSRIVSTELAAQQFIGPVLAGFLFAITKSAPFAAIAALLALAALAPGKIAGDFRPEVDPGDQAARPSMKREITEGMRWLFSHPVLRHLAIMVGALGFLGAGVLALLVLYGQETLGLSSRMIGVFLAVGAIGSVAGSVAAPRARQLVGTGPVLALSVVGIGVPTMGFALTHEPIVAMVLFAVSSTAAMVWNVITLALRQALIPDEILGRAFATYRLLAYGSVPLGASAAGLVATWTSLGTVFVVAGALHLVLIAGYARLLMVAGRDYEAITSQASSDSSETYVDVTGGT
jgi:transmembrane secretion effector